MGADHRPTSGIAFKRRQFVEISPAKDYWIASFAFINGKNNGLFTCVSQGCKVVEQSGQRIWLKPGLVGQHKKDRPGFGLLALYSLYPCRHRKTLTFFPARIIYWFC